MATSETKPPEQFKLIVRSLPGDRIPAITRLRTLLKHLLRSHGFQVVEAAEVKSQRANDSSPREREAVAATKDP